MATFATPHDGTGTVLRFGANAYTVTNVVIANTNPADDAATIDVAHLGQTVGETSATMDAPLAAAAGAGEVSRQITFDYIGKTILLDGATGTVFISIAGTALVGTTGVAATNFIATVQSSTLTLATNDAVRGQGVLSLARTASIT
jgi:hypothetical protein